MCGLGRPRIEKHDRHVALGELREQGAIELRGHDRDAAHAALDEPPDVARHPLRVVVGVREDQIEIMLERRALHLLDQVGEERVRDVRDDEPDEAAAAKGEAAGVRVGVVVVALDGAEHHLARRRGHGATLVDDAGHGRRGYARLAGDIGQHAAGARRASGRSSHGAGDWEAKGDTWPGL